jgi:hypothetical protein
MKLFSSSSIIIGINKLECFVPGVTFMSSSLTHYVSGHSAVTVYCSFFIQSIKSNHQVSTFLVWHQIEQNVLDTNARKQLSQAATDV